MKLGDLVRREDERLGIVMSEVFDFRPSWEDEYPAVKVWTRHAHTNDLIFACWLLEDIEVISESR